MKRFGDFLVATFLIVVGILLGAQSAAAQA